MSSCNPTPLTHDRGSCGLRTVCPAPALSSARHLYDPLKDSAIVTDLCIRCHGLQVRKNWLESFTLGFSIGGTAFAAAAVLFGALFERSLKKAEAQMTKEETRATEA